MSPQTHLSRTRGPWQVEVWNTPYTPWTAVVRIVNTHTGYRHPTCEVSFTPWTGTLSFVSIDRLAAVPKYIREEAKTMVRELYKSSDGRPLQIVRR